MNTNHTKYQSLSAVEANAIHAEVERRVQTAHDDGQQAGYDAGVDFTINRITAVNFGSQPCRVNGCKNFDRSGVRNCREDLSIECGSFKPEIENERVKYNV